MRKLNWVFIITWILIFCIGFLLWRALFKLLYETIL